MASRKKAYSDEELREIFADPDSDDTDLDLDDDYDDFDPVSAIRSRFADDSGTGSEKSHYFEYCSKFEEN